VVRRLNGKNARRRQTARESPTTGSPVPRRRRISNSARWRHQIRSVVQRQRDTAQYESVKVSLKLCLLLLQADGSPTSRQETIRSPLFPDLTQDTCTQRRLAHRQHLLPTHQTTKCTEWAVDTRRKIRLLGRIQPERSPT